MSVSGQIFMNWQKKQRELLDCCLLHHPSRVIFLSCSVIWIEMFVVWWVLVIIHVGVVTAFCTYQWEVQKCTIEMYKSGARALIPPLVKYWHIYLGGDEELIPSI